MKQLLHLVIPFLCVFGLLFVLSSCDSNSLEELPESPGQQSSPLFASKGGPSNSCTRAVNDVNEKESAYGALVRGARKTCKSGACDDALLLQFENAFAALSAANAVMMQACEVPAPPGIEICDGVDNDGDGLVDEEFPFCIAGAPAPNTDGRICLAGFEDTDGLPNNGCETELIEICGDGLDNDKDGLVDEGCPYQTILHSGTISTDETWSRDFVHVLTADVYVQGTTNPMLTIEDGTEIRAETNAGLYVGWSESGQLLAEGTGIGILFTSASQTAQSGDWDGISFGLNDQHSSASGLIIEYGGGNGFGNVYINSPNPTIADSDISYSNEWGVYLTRSASRAQLLNNTYYQNVNGDIYPE